MKHCKNCKWSKRRDDRLGFTLWDCTNKEVGNADPKHCKRYEEANP
jgi:hypothetical protein